MKLEVQSDIQMDFEGLASHPGWKRCVRHFAEERDQLTRVLTHSVKAEDSIRVMDLQARVRMLEWLAGGALRDIEASEVEKAKKT